MHRLLGLVLALAFTLGGLAYAHGPEGGKGSNSIQDRIEILTAWKMIEALNLDNATAEKVLEIRRQFTAKRKELKKSMDDDFAKLKNLLKEPRSGEEEKELAATLTNIRAKRIKLKDLWIDHYDEVSKVLTVRQQAELVLFLKNFRRELHALLRPPHPPYRPGNPPDESPTKAPPPPHPQQRNGAEAPPGGWHSPDE